MKKVLLFLIIITGMLFFGLPDQKVSAANYSTGSCSNSSPIFDNQHFPYGFLCGSDNNDRGTGLPTAQRPIFIGVTPGQGVDDTSDPFAGTDPASAIQISPRNFLDIDLGFNASDIPRNKSQSLGGTRAPVLVWAYVLAGGGSTAFAGPPVAPAKYHPGNITNINFGGSSGYCPGAGGAGAGTIYNYNGPDPDRSPAGYVSSIPIGFEDCSDHGLMAYWTDVVANGAGDVGLRHFKFRINLDPASNQAFCVREQVAVDYSSVGGGSSVFAGSTPNGSMASQPIASHIAKQSDVRCYQQSQPKGTLTISCPNRTYSLTGYDPANQSAGVSYRVTNGGATTYFSGATRKSPPTTGTFTFIANTTYHLEIKINSVSPWVDVATVNVAGCGGGPVTGQCTSVLIHDNGLYTVPSTGITYPSRSWAAVYEVESGRLLAAGKAGRQQTNPSLSASPPFSAGVNVNPLVLGPYTPLTQHIVVQTDREYYNGSAWVDQEGPDNTLGTGGYTCYSGTCQIIGVTNINDGSSDLVAGQGYYFTVQMNNDNPDPAGLDFPVNLAGAPLSLTDAVTGAGNPTGGGVLKGTSEIFYVFGTAPDVGGPTFIQFNPYPDFYGLMTPVGLGPACGPVFVPIDYPFTISPYAAMQMTPTDEAPTNIAYQAGANNPYGFPIDDPGTVEFSGPIGGTGSVPYNLWPANSVPFLVLNGNLSPTPVNAGDHYCIRSTLAFTSGLATPFGTTINPSGGPSTQSQCKTVSNKPFFRAQNGSIRAGGDFVGSTCRSGDGATSGGVIGGYANNLGSPYGSGTGLAAIAQIKITGVASALGTATLPRTGATLGSALSLGNNGTGVDPTAPDAQNPILGGNFGGGGAAGAAHCIELPQPPPAKTAFAGSSFDIPTQPAGAYEHTGDLTLTANGIWPFNSVGIGKNTALYVHGNVYIQNNIAYNNLLPWTVSPINSANNVPSFTLVVTGGNIYVNPAITNLDGIYVAAKAGGIGGTIYTCGLSTFTKMPSTDLFGLCKNQLMVNGALVANQVNLMRTYGSLRDGNSPPLLGCSNGGFTVLPANCAAEVIRFTPEMYLSNPPINLPSNGANQYDALTSVPPVL